MSKPLYSLTQNQSSWNLLLSFLPRSWRQLARTTGAFCYPRELRTPLDLLRLLLMHGAGLSLRHTGVRAEAVGWRSVSAETLQRHLERCGAWLQALTQGLLGERAVDKTRFHGREVLLADATAVSRPGSSGTDYRLHYVLQLQGLACRFYRLTGAETGETFRLFDFPAGAVVVGDRIYGSPAGLAWVVEKQCDALVRVNVQNLRLFEAPEGAPVDLRELGRGLQEREVRSSVTWFRHKKKWYRGRAIVKKLGAAEAAKARRRLGRRSSRKGEKVSARSWELAEYLIVWTSLGEEWTDAEVLELYRRRWQIELLFKRLKSLLDLDELAKEREETGRVWLQIKLLLALWLEALRRQGEGAGRSGSRRVRSLWREWLWWWEELKAVLIPLVGLKRSKDRWKQIAEALAEPPRKRVCQSALLLQTS